MIQLTINTIPVELKEGSTLLQAAAQAGVEIPTLCHDGQLEHFTSCMVCMVMDNATGKLLPACTAKAYDGMVVITGGEEILEARKVALELLLSEHAGDCEAPCRVSCPAFMDIPTMNRLMAAGKMEEALQVVMKDIALPAVMGRICPAPCEGACKRKPIDEAVSICLLKRFTADAATAYPEILVPEPTGKKVAIIGAGPAGLAAAFYLQQKGISVKVYDANPLPGGALRYSIPDEELEKAVLDREIDHIAASGVEFMLNTKVDVQLFSQLCNEYDAVILATGDYTSAMDAWGLENNGKQLLVNKSTYQTSMDNVFAIGNVNRSARMAIRSAAQGKEMAKVIMQLFSGQPVEGEKRAFNSTLGKLMEVEFAEYMKEGSAERRQQPQAEPGSGFDEATARREAARCLHCDCRKPDTCKLRIYAGEYEAAKKRFAYTTRKPVKKIIQQDLLVYEPGKCIKCGICVRITAKQKERFGFTFIGRGFDVEIGIPFGQNLEHALEKTAEDVVKACPTGALAPLKK